MALHRNPARAAIHTLASAACSTADAHKGKTCTFCTADVQGKGKGKRAFTSANESSPDSLRHNTYGPQQQVRHETAHKDPNSHQTVQTDRQTDRQYSTHMGLLWAMKCRQCISRLTWRYKDTPRSLYQSVSDTVRWGMALKPGSATSLSHC